VNWKNSMSCRGTPRRASTAGPSPVFAYALDVTRKHAAEPPVAKSTAFAVKRWTSPVQALWPRRRSSGGRRESRPDVELVEELHAVLDALL